MFLSGTLARHLSRDSIRDFCPDSKNGGEWGIRTYESDLAQVSFCGLLWPALTGEFWPSALPCTSLDSVLQG
jgi:hypothetical protein